MPVSKSVRGLQTLFIVASCVAFTGCSTMRNSQQTNDYQERIQFLERELRRRQLEIQDLKERNLVLEQRLRRGDSSVEAPAVETMQKSGQKATAPHDQSPAPAKMSASEPTGDQMLYSKILQTYRKRNLSEMEKSLALLMKTYPESVYADNALYLCGQLAYEQGDYQLAGQYMDRVLRLYPKGNKSVSALFAKAIIEKKQSRFGQAKRLLEQLRDQYPGSPEAMRVATELKLIEMAKTQKRGM